MSGSASMNLPRTLALRAQAQKHASPGALRNLIVESWSRCRQTGLSPMDAPFRKVSADDLMRRLSANRGLVKAAIPHLEWVAAGMAGAPYVVYVTDSDGIVLHAVYSDRQLARAGALEPGFDWSENAMGTNGAGTALATGHPVAITRHEHYLCSLSGWTCTAAPVRACDGTILGAIDASTTSTDDSPERVVLVSYAAELIGMELSDQANKSGLNTVGAIAAGIAHDLNNPLAVISARSELMLSLLDNGNPDLRQDLEVVHHNAERASRIANGLLSLAARRTTVHEPVNVNQLVEAAILLVGGEFRRSNIEITSALERDLPPVLGDPTALQRVLLNLLLNARDAMPEGGKISIASGAASARSGMLELSVADAGIGIPADALPRVFDMFFTTRKASGTGLGLWIARRTLREHGGEIEVESSPGKGTRFTLTLPIMRDR